MKVCRWCGEEFEGNEARAYCKTECRLYAQGSLSPFPGEDWFDGPSFLAWLEHVVPSALVVARRKNGGGGHLSNLGRNLKRWQNGTPVSVYTADHYLTHLGLHLQQVPKEVFCESPKKAVAA